MVLDPHHVAVVWAIRDAVEAGLARYCRYPAPVGPPVRAVKTFPLFPRPLALDGKGTVMSPALMVVGASNQFPTCIFDFADHQGGGPSKHAQYITTPARGAHAVVSLQLSLSAGDWLGDDKKMARLANNSYVWVWTNDQGKANPVVKREPLSTPNGEIRLWLSDLIEKTEDLPDDFRRPIDGL